MQKHLEKMTIEYLISLRNDPTIQKIVPPRVLVLHPDDFQRLKGNPKFPELEQYFEVIEYPIHLYHPNEGETNARRQQAGCRSSTEQTD